MVNVVGVSVMSHQLGTDDATSYHKVFWANLVSTGAVVVCVSAAVIALGPLALGVFGDEFVRGYPALVMLMVAASLETICIAAAQPLQRRDRMWTLFFGVIVPVYSVLLAVAAILAPSAGAAGAAIAYAAGWTVGLLCTAGWVLRLGIWKAR
jgi:O-antigen/teichoic acid export membrane protein